MLIFFIVDMDASVARRLVQGLKTHKRKDASTSGLVKKARTEGTSLAAPVPVAVAVEVPSDAEPEVPRALLRSPPTEDPASEARPEGAPGAEGRRRKKTLDPEESQSQGCRQGGRRLRGRSGGKSLQ